MKKIIFVILKNQIFFQVNKKFKKNIVNIMGLFFTGGIERYIYYIDKYGDFKECQHYLLCMNEYEKIDSFY